jgi:argininosuccinate lyase
LLALSGLYDAVVFVDERMAEAADSSMTAATDLAEHLVSGGMPFREAHAAVGTLVRQSIERGVPFEELVATDPRLGPEALTLLAPGAGVQRRLTPGGAGPKAVVAQVALAQQCLVEERAWLAS